MRCTFSSDAVSLSLSVNDTTVQKYVDNAGVITDLFCCGPSVAISAAAAAPTAQFLIRDLRLHVSPAPDDPLTNE